jgi:hypothetical protein
LHLGDPLPAGSPSRFTSGTAKCPTKDRRRNR